METKRRYSRLLFLMARELPSGAWRSSKYHLKSVHKIVHDPCKVKTCFLYTYVVSGQLAPIFYISSCVLSDLHSDKCIEDVKTDRKWNCGECLLPPCGGQQAATGLLIKARLARSLFPGSSWDISIRPLFLLQKKKIRETKRGALSWL
jgi:hypothetical protein